MLPHLPASSVVVQVHECTGIPLLPLLGIHEGLAEAYGMLHMVTTASPVEGAFGILWWALLAGITGARIQLTLAAGLGQCVNHSSWGDSVDKGHLTATFTERIIFLLCKKKKKFNYSVFTQIPVNRSQKPCWFQLFVGVSHLSVNTSAGKLASLARYSCNSL